MVSVMGFSGVLGWRGSAAGTVRGAAGGSCGSAFGGGRGVVRPLVGEDGVLQRVEALRVPDAEDFEIHGAQSQHAVAVHAAVVAGGERGQAVADGGGLGTQLVVQEVDLAGQVVDMVSEFAAGVVAATVTAAKVGGGHGEVVPDEPLAGENRGAVGVDRSGVLVGGQMTIPSGGSIGVSEPVLARCSPGWRLWNSSL